MKGQINLTDNTWQALNADAYFIIIGHWIEELGTGWSRVCCGFHEAQ